MHKRVPPSIQVEQRGLCRLFEAAYSCVFGVHDSVDQKPLLPSGCSLLREHTTSTCLPGYSGFKFNSYLFHAKVLNALSVPGL